MKLIPLNQDKTPQVRDWRQDQNHEAHTALTTTDGSRMYGVLTGEPNGIVVFDYDTKKEGENKGKVVDVDGNIYDFEKLKSTYGEGAYIVKTRSGGFHVYCALDERVKEWRNRAGIHGYLDIRATGGYVVGGHSPGYSVLQGDINNLTSVPDEMYTLITGLQKQNKTKRNKHKSNETIDEHRNVVLVKILENEGFSNVAFRWASAPYNFDCDQVGQGLRCPLCGEQHDNNKFFVSEGTAGELYVRNHSEKCVTQLLDSYDAVKLLFERDVCRINDCLTYPCEDGGKTVLRNKKELIERYAEWTYKDAKGEEKSFIYAWLLDKKKRQFTKMDFCPENCPSDVYNLWEGYDVEEIDPKIGKQGTIQPFLDLLDALTDGETKYALDYLTLLFKHPGQKPRTCLIFKGREGDGKGRLSATIQKLMGKSLFYETNDSSATVFGQFADAFDRTKLVVMNETQSKTNFAHESKLKSLITDEDGLRIDKKYHTPYVVANKAGIIMNTNDRVPVIVTEGGRRFVVYQTNPKYNNDQVFFSQYMDWLEDEANQRALYDFFLSRDVSQVDWVEDRPITRAYQQMRNSCLPQIVKWLVYLVVEDWPNTFGLEVSGRRLHEHFNRFSTSDQQVNSASFGLKMRRLLDDYDLGEELIQKITRNTGTFWRLDRLGLYEWLLEKGYTDHEGELPTPTIQRNFYADDDMV